MSKNTDNVLVKIDFWILDTLFQPLANRLPGEKMNLRVGTNLVLGLVIFSFAFLLLPMFLYGVGLFHSTYNLMSCVMMSCFYAYVHQSQGLVREGFVNPLRYHLFGIRIISIPFALYSVYVWMTAGTLIGRITLFYCISNILSVCGLYLVSCNVNPPKKQEHRKVVFSENPFS